MATDGAVTPTPPAGASRSRPQMGGVLRGSGDGMDALVQRRSELREEQRRKEAERKDYIRTHGLHLAIGAAVEDCLADMPPDPCLYIANWLLSSTRGYYRESECDPSGVLDGGAARLHVLCSEVEGLNTAVTEAMLQEKEMQPSESIRGRTPPAPCDAMDSPGSGAARKTPVTVSGSGHGSAESGKNLVLSGRARRLSLSGGTAKSVSGWRPDVEAWVASPTLHSPRTDDKFPLPDDAVVCVRDALPGAADMPAIAGAVSARIPALSKDVPMAVLQGLVNGIASDSITAALPHLKAVAQEDCPPTSALPELVGAVVAGISDRMGGLTDEQRDAWLVLCSCVCHQLVEPGTRAAAGSDRKQKLGSSSRLPDEAASSLRDPMLELQRSKLSSLESAWHLTPSQSVIKQPSEVECVDYGPLTVEQADMIRASWRRLQVLDGFAACVVANFFVLEPSVRATHANLSSVIEAALISFLQQLIICIGSYTHRVLSMVQDLAARSVDWGVDGHHPHQMVSAFLTAVSTMDPALGADGRKAWATLSTHVSAHFVKCAEIPSVEVLNTVRAQWRAHSDEEHRKVIELALEEFSRDTPAAAAMRGASGAVHAMFHLVCAWGLRTDRVPLLAMLRNVGQHHRRREGLTGAQCERFCQCVARAASTTFTECDAVAWSSVLSMVAKAIAAGAADAEDAIPAPTGGPKTLIAAAGVAALEPVRQSLASVWVETWTGAAASVHLLDEGGPLVTQLEWVFYSAVGCVADGEHAAAVHLHSLGERWALSGLSPADADLLTGCFLTALEHVAGAVPAVLADACQVSLSVALGTIKQGMMEAPVDQIRAPSPEDVQLVRECYRAAIRLPGDRFARRFMHCLHLVEPHRQQLPVSTIGSAYTAALRQFNDLGAASLDALQAPDSAKGLWSVAQAMCLATALEGPMPKSLRQSWMRFFWFAVAPRLDSDLPDAAALDLSACALPPLVPEHVDSIVSTWRKLWFGRVPEVESMYWAVLRGRFPETAEAFTAMYQDGSVLSLLDLLVCRAGTWQDDDSWLLGHVMLHMKHLGDDAARVAHYTNLAMAAGALVKREVGGGEGESAFQAWVSIGKLLSEAAVKLGGKASEAADRRVYLLERGGTATATRGMSVYCSGGINVGAIATKHLRAVQQSWYRADRVALVNAIFQHLGELSPCTKSLFGDKGPSDAHTRVFLRFVDEVIAELGREHASEIIPKLQSVARVHNRNGVRLPHFRFFGAALLCALAEQPAMLQDGAREGWLRLYGVLSRTLADLSGELSQEGGPQTVRAAAAGLAARVKEIDPSGIAELKRSILAAPEQESAERVVTLLTLRIKSLRGVGEGHLTACVPKVVGALLSVLDVAEEIAVNGSDSATSEADLLNPLARLGSEIAAMGTPGWGGTTDLGDILVQMFDSGHALVQMWPCIVSASFVQAGSRKL